MIFLGLFFIAVALFVGASFIAEEIGRIADALEQGNEPRIEIVSNDTP